MARIPVSGCRVRSSGATLGHSYSKCSTSSNQQGVCAPRRYWCLLFPTRKDTQVFSPLPTGLVSSNTFLKQTPFSFKQFLVTSRPSCPGIKYLPLPRELCASNGAGRGGRFLKTAWDTVYLYNSSVLSVQFDGSELCNHHHSVTLKPSHRSRKDPLYPLAVTLPFLQPLTNRNPCSVSVHLLILEM